ncbi:MAG: energy transducer TonB [Sphingomicrobium sp.]
MSTSRTPAIIIVALIHVGLGYALVTGLAYNVAKKAMEDLKTFDVTEEPPPPPEEVPPPPERSDTPPPPQVVAPPPLVRMAPTTSPIVSIPVAPPPQITPRPAPPAPPAPPAVRTVPPQSVSGSMQGLIRESDYPPSSLDREEQGVVAVSLSVGTNGRVTGCSVTSSSGSKALDSTTCRVLSSRAKFSPAKDNMGNPTTGTSSARIRWQIAG